MKKILALLLALLVTPAAAQSVQQSGGFVTPGHIPYWVTNGVIGDAGSAQSSVLTSIGTTGPGSTICANSGATTGPYNQLCLGVNPAAAAQIVLQNFGGAAAQTLQFVINGTTYSLDTSGTIIAAHATLTTLANVATTSAVCYNVGTGVLTYDGTIGTCNTSTMRVKHDIQPLNIDSLHGVMAMRPVSFYYNDEQHTSGQQLGLIAEDLAAIDSRLVSYDEQGQPNSIRFLGPLHAYEIGAIQELARRVGDLERKLNR